MCRVFILLFLSPCFLTVLSAQPAHSIEWGHPIAYADFKSGPAETDTAAANISVTILLGYAAGRSGNLKFKVVAVMDPMESWIRDGFRTERILNHEQGHFDIAHIYAKKLEAKLKGSRYTNKDIAFLDAIYDEFLGMMNALQMQYDRETGGGSRRAEQAKWKAYIQRELAGL